MGAQTIGRHRMRRLPRETREHILHLLVEGMSIRSTTRVTGVSKTTILKLLVDAGRLCARFHRDQVRDLPCTRIQADELWAFVGMKARNVPEERRGDPAIGDVWTFVAMCPDTKIVPSWLVGPRTPQNAQRLLLDVARRVKGRIQLTTDGADFYREAAWAAFTGFVDYAQLVKRYASEQSGGHRYSPPVCVGADPRIIQGEPDSSHISTSHVERQNLTIRMSMRRFTRLTNAFSKKVLNLQAAVAIHYWHYNFARPHGTLTARANGKPTTPAMAAGISRRVWTLNELVALLEEREPTAREISERRFDRTTGYHGERPA